MSVTVYYSIFLIILIIPPILIYVFKKKINIIVESIIAGGNWPVLGQLPELLWNVDRLHEYVTDTAKDVGGTFEFKGPCFADLDMLFTSDPANINHILTKNFNNYPKGQKFRRIFGPLGDGVFNVDSELWKLHRKTIISVLNGANFPLILEAMVGRKLEDGLLPVLDSYAESGAEFDLQEMLQRFTFDLITQVLVNKDPCSLCLMNDNGSPDPYDPLHRAFRDSLDATFYRHVLPEGFWMLQKWLGLGREKKYAHARVVIEEFMDSIFPEDDVIDEESACNVCMLNSYKKSAYQDIINVSSSSSSSTQFLKESLLSLFFAGRDTSSVALTWFFWLLAKNPQAEEKIRQEMEIKLPQPNINKFFKAEECRDLVYLHGGLCESLRLYPPVPLNHKVSVEADVLPTGHRVGPNKRVILSFYTMGRMEEIWGEDCMEFKPERWVSPSNGVKHIPYCKFPAFNAGPRNCVGKQMSFVVMKMVATAVLKRYKVELVEGHPVIPNASIILHAKHGLMVKLIPRQLQNCSR